MTKLKQPVFLICGERSGSNLIRAIMNSHSAFFAPMPLHLMRLLWAKVDAYGDLSKDENWDALIRHTCMILRDQVGTIGKRSHEEDIRENVSERSFEDIFNYVYLSAMQETTKKRLFLKELYVHQFLPLILAHYPDAKFVYQVRDPRDVVLSMMKLPLQGGLLWASHVLREEQEGFLNAYHTLTADRVFVQRYEDLLERPEDVLKSLCEFLEVEFEEQMLEFHKTKESKDSSGKSVAWKNLAQPLMTNNHGKYRNALTRLEISLIEAYGERVLEAFEYERDVSALSSRGKLIYRLSRFGRARNQFDKLFKKKQLALTEEERLQREKLAATLQTIRNERSRLDTCVRRTY